MSTDASVTTRRGLGRGLEVLIGGAGDSPSCSTCRSRRSTRIPGSLAAVSSRRRPPAWRRRSGFRASYSLSSCGRGPMAATSSLRVSAAGGQRATPALPTLPAVVREADDRDALLLGLVENVARENLSPVEEARAYASLIDEFELSLGDVAERVGRSKAVGLEPRPPARPAGGGAVDARPGRADRGPRPCCARSSGRRGSGEAREANRVGGHDGSRRRTRGAGRGRPPPAAYARRLRRPGARRARARAQRPS